MGLFGDLQPIRLYQRINLGRNEAQSLIFKRGNAYCVEFYIRFLEGGQPYVVSGDVEVRIKRPDDSIILGTVISDGDFMVVFATPECFEQIGLHEMEFRNLEGTVSTVFASTFYQVIQALLT